MSHMISFRMKARGGRTSGGVVGDPLRMDPNCWRYCLGKGDVVDCLDTESKWYTAAVIDVTTDLIRVQYDGWNTKWNEWIERMSGRIGCYKSMAVGGKGYGIKGVSLIVDKDSWIEGINTDDKIDCKDYVHKWYTAVVAEMKGTRLLIRFDGWS
eukprot:510384_1